MPYSWAQLAFVEQWRRHGVRGLIVGMHRPEDRTYFDLRLRPGEGNVRESISPTDLHLQDRGDIIREKRLSLLERALVVVRISVTRVDGQDTTPRGRSRRWLDPGCCFVAAIAAVDDTMVLLDVGLPLVAEVRDSTLPSVGESLTFRVEENPMGFIIV